MNLVNLLKEYWNLFIRFLQFFYIFENKMKTLKNKPYNSSLQHTCILCNEKVFRENLECVKLKYWEKT